MRAVVKTEFGLDLPALVPLSGGRVNQLWQSGDWVVKVYDHGQVPRERAERAVRLQQLAAAHGLPVPEPLRTRGGGLWAESAEGMVVVMPHLRGLRRTRGTLSKTEAANLGALLGRMHALFRSLPLEPLTPPSPPAPAVILDLWEGLRQQAQAVELPTEFDQVVMATAAYVKEALPRMPQVGWASLPWQLCHGDLHLDNLLFGEAGAIVGVLDFDNAAPSWPAVELMMAWNLCFHADPGCPAHSAEAAAFFAAYRQAHPLDLERAMDAYWLTLVSNTWPAAIRYREGTVKPDWVEIMQMRLRAAQWLDANREGMRWT